jgi:hypothetical protein
MKRSKCLVILLLLFCTSLSTTIANPLTESQGADLALLRKHDQHRYNASPEIMAAARRIFSRMHFEGRSAAEVEAMLGRPAETFTRDHSLVYGYMYHNGEMGVHARLAFDAKTKRVSRFEVLPTQ